MRNLFEMHKTSVDHIALARDRLGHACLRFNGLIHECNQYIASNPFHVVREFFETVDAIPSVRFRYRVNASPPARLSLLAGEVVHQLRAILDNLVWGAGQVFSSPNPKAVNDKLSFPVAESEKQYFNLLQRPEYLGISYFPRELQEAIADAQSFRRSLDGPDLFLLNQLWIADKHKLLSVFIMHSNGISQDMDLRSPARVSVGEIVDGAVFLEGAIPPQGLSDDAAPQLTSVVLGLNDPRQPSAKYACAPLFLGYIQLVEGVLGEFARVLLVDNG